MSAPTLGARAVAAGMRWMPRMQCIGGETLLSVALHDGSWWAAMGPHPELDGVQNYWMPTTPNLDDPATQGCILAQASPAGAAIDIRRCVGGWRWRAVVVYGYPTPADERELQTVKLGPIVPTYGEACVSAMEGSPS